MLHCLYVLRFMAATAATATAAATAGTAAIATAATAAAGAADDGHGQLFTGLGAITIYNMLMPHQIILFTSRFPF